MEDWIVSLITGVAIGLGIIIMTPKYPKAAQLRSSTVESDIPEAVTNNPKLQKIFGVDSKSLSEGKSEAQRGDPGGFEPEDLQSVDEKEAHAKAAIHTNIKLQKFFGVDKDGKSKLSSEEAAKELISTKPHLQKFFGTEEMTGVESSKSDLLSGEDDEDDGALWSIVVSSIFIVIVAVGVMTGVNILSNGDFGRLLVGLFPVETEALRIKEFLTRFHVR